MITFYATPQTRAYRYLADNAARYLSHGSLHLINQNLEQKIPEHICGGTTNTKFSKGMTHWKACNFGTKLNAFVLLMGRMSLVLINKQ